MFTDSLSPALDAFGMDGTFRIKEKQHEGLATFYRRSDIATCLKKTNKKYIKKHHYWLIKSIVNSRIYFFSFQVKV